MSASAMPMSEPGIRRYWRDQATWMTIADVFAILAALTLPWSTLKSGFPVLKSPANTHRAVALSLEEFRKQLAGESQFRRLLFRVYVVSPAVEAAYREASAKP